MKQPEEAKSLKEPNAEKLNQFIDHAIQLEKSGPIIFYSLQRLSLGYFFLSTN